MLTWLVIILIILWLLGYVSVDYINLPNITLFTLNGQPITIWNILMLLVIGWIISILPSPIREIGGVLLILWILSLLGILAIAGLSNLIMIAIIVGLIFFILKGIF
jgi:hypothetical protein